MFSYYDTEIINNKEVIDIWKKVDLSKFLNSNDFIFHSLNEQENLMTLSYKYYGTINDWWAIFLFNKLYDVNFCILLNDTIKNTQDSYVYDVMFYDSITRKRQQYIEYLIREFYSKSNTIEQSILLTVDRLSTNLKRRDDEFIDEFKLYIFNELINSSTYRIQIKIPSNQVVYDIKTELEKYSITWKTK